MNDDPDGRSPDGISPSDDCTLGSSGDDPLLRAVAAAPYPTRLIPDLAIGTIVAETYEIVGPLGAGAMGVVYQAIDRALDRRVALKLHVQRDGADPRRVWREARAMARLADPHVVTIHEVGIHDERLFIAMELVAGSDARRWLRSAPRTTAEILAVYRQAGLGLAAAHAVGIVHRDFKPDNVLVGNDGRVRVADFGLARSVDRGATQDDDTTAAADTAARHTVSGFVAGTPAYMAPEIVAGSAADARSDQYAFCVAMVEALVGERPARAARGAETEVPKHGLPRHLHDALRRGLSREPSARFDDMPALLRALEPPRRRWPSVAVAATLVAGGLTVAATRTRPCEDDAFRSAAPWDAEHHGRVAAAFERSGFPDAAQVSARLDAALSSWSTDATVARRTACEATHVHGDQSEARMQLRIDCIDRMQRRVTALVTSLERADAGVVARADDAVDRLPELTRCEETSALAQAEPIADGDRDAHAALRERVDALSVERDLGRSAGLADAVAELVTAAEAGGYADNIAAATLLQGQDAIDRAAYDSATAALGRSIAAGWRARDLDTTIEAMRLLSRALGSSPSRLDEALRWLDAAVELARTEAPSPDRDARLALTRSDALYVAGRNGDSERIARAALAWIPAGSALEAAARATLGNALMAQRRNLEAIAEHRRAVALTEQLRGARHPEVATRRAGLGVALDDAGQYDEGAAEAARVLEMRESVFGPNSAAVATALAQVGENQRYRNDTAGELASYERALAISVALDPPDDALRIRIVGNMIPPLAFAGRLDEARTLLGDVLPVAERVFGRDSLRLAELLQMLATTEELLENYEQAVAHGVEAVRLFERHLGADNPRTGEAQLALASTMIETGRYDEAMAVLERAGRTFAAAPDSHRRGLGFVAALRADALSRSGREREALEAGAHAVALFDQVYPDGHVEQAEILVNHAERVARAGQPREARALLLRARAMVQDPAVDPAVREEIDRLIRGLPEG